MLFKAWCTAMGQSSGQGTRKTWSHFLSLSISLKERYTHVNIISNIDYNAQFEYNLIQSRASQPRHYWHFRLDNSLLWGTVLYIVGCLVALLASAYQRHALPHCNNQKSLQTFAKCLLEMGVGGRVGKVTLGWNHWYKHDIFKYFLVVMDHLMYCLQSVSDMPSFSSSLRSFCGQCWDISKRAFLIVREINTWMPI